MTWEMGIGVVVLIVVVVGLVLVGPSLVRYMKIKRM